MVETDAPFLLPRDLKGARSRRNEPAFLPHVAAAVARFAGRSDDELRRDTNAAATKLFSLVTPGG
jgi:TatD DNase family protein